MFQILRDPVSYGYSFYGNEVILQTKWCDRVPRVVYSYFLEINKTLPEKSCYAKMGSDGLDCLMGGQS